MDGFLSRWEIVLEQLPHTAEAFGEIAGFVSLVVVAMCVLLFGFGGVVCLLSGGWRRCKPETEIEAEVRRMKEISS
jgi:hypothetical protein